MGYQARTRTFQFQGPQGSAGGSGGGGKFGGNIVGGSAGYGTGRGQAQAKARAQKKEAFGALAKGRAGPAEIQSRAKGLFSKQVLDPEVEAARAGDVVAGAEKQALRKLQASRGAKTGDITARGKLSIKRALKGTGERTMLKARGDAKQAADIANRQAQQDALRLEMGAQAQQAPFDMEEASFISREQFNTPDPRGGGFSFSGGGSRGGAAYGGVLGASFNKPRRGRGDPEPESDAASRRRVASQHTPAQRKQAMAAGQAAVMGMFGFGGSSAPSGLSAAQKAANRQSHRDAAARRKMQTEAMRGAVQNVMTRGMGFGAPAPQPWDPWAGTGQQTSRQSEMRGWAGLGQPHSQPKKWNEWGSPSPVPGVGY